MKDLTRGPIFRQLVEMALPIALGVLLQPLYFVVDLYFVAQLGDAALAGPKLSVGLLRNNEDRRRADGIATDRASKPSKLQGR